MAAAEGPAAVRPAGRGIGHVIELDGLRGLAIASVLVWHYVACTAISSPGTLPAYALRLLAFTWSGVDLFFVLSGFLVGGILIERDDRPGTLRRFLARRGARILPLYAVVLATFLIWRPFGGGADWLFADAMPGWSYVALVQNVAMARAGLHGANWLSPTWSLAVEAQLYLVLGIALTRLPRRRALALLALVVVASPLLRTALFFAAPGGGFANYVLLPTRADGAAFGVLVAAAVRDPRGRAWIASRRSSLRLLAGAAMATTIGLCAVAEGPGSLGMAAIGHTALAVAGAAMIALLVVPDREPLARPLRSRPLRALGTISYGVYLIHQPVAGLVHHYVGAQPPRLADVADLAVTLAALVLTFALALASWRWLERPVIAWSARFR